MPPGPGIVAGEPLVELQKSTIGSELSGVEQRTVRGGESWLGDPVQSMISRARSRPGEAGDRCCGGDCLLALGRTRRTHGRSRFASIAWVIGWTSCLYPPGMRQEVVELDALGASVCGRGSSVCPMRAASWRRDLPVDVYGRELINQAADLDLLRPLPIAGYFAEVARSHREIFRH
jgi:hypothetical protein